MSMLGSVGVVELDSLPLVSELSLAFTGKLPENLVARGCTVMRAGAGYVQHAFPVHESEIAMSPSKAKSGDFPGAGASAKRDTGDRKKNVKLDEEDLKVDWYDLLKLPKAEGSTADEIKTAYRRRCLDTHPDKQPDKSDELFKRVQRAFEILGNAEARRSYDSSRPFDDSIPDGDAVPESEFYATFGPVLDRNKKWSVDDDLPSLGDDTMPVAQVRKMYDAWLGFRSWRDFSNDVELEEIDEGMMREEKRYYQRHNQRLLEKMMREELKRVRTLVDGAMKNDPRLRRHRAQEEAARQKVLDERRAARDAAEEAKSRAKQEEEERERQAKEDEKQRAVTAKARLRDSVKAVADFLKDHDLIDTVATNKLLATVVRKPNVQWFMTKANAEEAEALRDAVVAASPALVSAAPPPDATEPNDDATTHVPAVCAFNRGVFALEQRVGRNRYGEALKKGGADAAAADAATKAKPKELAKWTDDDVIQLQKLAIKYPGGCVDRWRHIATALKGRFTEEQILEQVKVVETGWKAGNRPPSTVNSGVPEAPTAAATSASSVEDWTAKQQRQLEQGLREFQAYKEKDKFTKVASSVEGKTGKQCFERFKYLCAMRKQGATPATK